MPAAVLLDRFCAVARPLGVLWLREIIATYKINSLYKLSDDQLRAILAAQAAAHVAAP